MPKPKIFQDLSLAPYGKDRERWRWLYEQIRTAIQDGRLRAGTRLPSTRELAAQHKLSRGTVTAAFDRLHAEGYTTVQRGSGSYVSSDLPTPFVGRHCSRPKLVAEQPIPSLSRRANEYLKDVTVMPAPRLVGRAFRSYEPAVDLFPTDLWARVASRVLRHAPRSLYGHGDAAGYRPLRVSIAEYLGSARGVHCTPDRVLITTGSQQGLDLIARLLIDPGDSVWLEDPGYPGARYAFRAAAARLVPVPVDELGIMVSEGVRLSPEARLAYVTPGNQFPLGITMSAERRLALLNWAAKAGSWIVEDEYDAEYRYDGCPVAALQSLDRSDCVIYVGTFTKMLFNALRIGFMVLPPGLIQAFATLRSFVDRHPATLDQAILAEFINQGHYGHHVRKMRQVYAERLAMLSDLCREQIPTGLKMQKTVAGMRTIGWLKQDTSDKQVAEDARMQGLEVIALSSFSYQQRLPPALMLGFAACDEREIRRGVSTLSALLRSPSNGKVDVDLHNEFPGESITI